MGQSNISTYLNVCTKMLDWLKESNWRSYDPYDAGLSPIAKLLPERPWWILQHIIRLSPVNIRQFLYVDKQIHPKGLAHVMQACLILSNIERKAEMLNTAGRLSDKVVRLAIWDNDKCSWNYPFPYITRVLSVRDGTNIVNTSFIALALLDAYNKFHNPVYLDTALAAAKYIVDNIGYYSYPNGRICFYYAPDALQTLTIHNANLVCALLLNRLSKIHNNLGFKQLANAAALYSLDYQRDDGLWHYSEHPQWRLIDCLHNGFILDALMSIYEFECIEPFFSSIESGMQGFRTFLNGDGSVSHMLNHCYPKDIRSYSQFIKTGCLWSAYDPKWLQLADIAANYAIKTMFSTQGYCYYRRYRAMAIKTPFIRWSIGPMLLALANLIEKLRKIDD